MNSNYNILPQVVFGHSQFLRALISYVNLSELVSVRVNASNLLSRPLASLPDPILVAWISLNSENQGCYKVSSREGLFYLFFSSNSKQV